MIICLDYDGTYTADPDMWNRFIAMAKGCGHYVICATMRYETEPIEMPCEVFYTSRQAKIAFLANKGIAPDIYIDDQPILLYQGSS